MATLIKRGKKHQVKIRRLLPNGKYFNKTQTFDYLPQAKEWANKMEAKISLNKIDSNELSEFKDKTLYDALCLREIEFEKRTYQIRRNAFNHLKFCKKLPISKKELMKITKNDIVELRERQRGLVSNSTINRRMCEISGAFNIAIERGWIETNPLKGLSQLKENKGRDRRISENEIQQILKVLKFSDHKPIQSKKQLMGAFFLFALETGMRLGEICQINNNLQLVNHKKKYCKLTITKNGDIRNVPMSQRALILVKQFEKAKIKINAETASCLFRKYRDMTNIKDLRFHDTRHEAVTRLAKKLPILDLARMIGHRDLKSLQIYYNPTATEIAEMLD